MLLSIHYGIPAVWLSYDEYTHDAMRLYAGSCGIWPYIHRVPLYYIAVSTYTHATIMCIWCADVRKTYIGGANNFVSVFCVAVLPRCIVYICVGCL